MIVIVYGQIHVGMHPLYDNNMYWCHYYERRWLQHLQQPRVLLFELYQDSWDDQMVLLVCNHLNLIKQFGQMLFVLIGYNEKDSSFQTAFRTRARG